MASEKLPVITPLAMIVMCIAGALIVLGALWYGLTSDVLQRMWQNLTDRPGGPMTFRFFLQPTMATVAALYDGINDARLNRSPFLWTILNKPEKRSGRLLEALNSTARIILLGLGMDAIYQVSVLGTFYPVEALIIALALACVPYALLRGPIARVVSWWIHRSPSSRTP